MNVIVLIHSGFRMWTIPEAQVEALRARFPEHAFLHARDDDQGEMLIGGADVAFSGQITPRQLQRAGRLRWIHSPSAGIAGLLSPQLVSSPIVVTNARGLSAETIAEHVVALTLALFRRLPLAVRRQQERVWAQDEVGAPPATRTIAGSRVLIVGLGGIGRAAALRLHALGARVTGTRRSPSGSVPAGVDEVRGAGDLHLLLPHADVVVLAAPQTAETRDLLGAAEIAHMKRDAVLINVSRGGLVDEEALSDALRSGRLAGAAIDVARGEPLPPDHPLWDVPNLLITPHTAGFRADHWDASVELFAENLRRFAAGEPLRNVVDKQAGY